MSDVINREPLIQEREWFLHHGVPVHTLDFILDGFNTAFGKTAPDIATYYTELLFKSLRLHPLVCQPGARDDGTDIIAPLKWALEPLTKIMKNLQKPVQAVSPESRQIREAFVAFHGRVLSGRAAIRDQATVFRIICKIGTPKLGL